VPLRAGGQPIGFIGLQAGFLLRLRLVGRSPTGRRVERSQSIQLGERGGQGGPRSKIPPGPLPARRLIGRRLTGRRVGPLPSGPEAKIETL
jgi:hypothetical protein